MPTISKNPQISAVKLLRKTLSSLNQLEVARVVQCDSAHNDNEKHPSLFHVLGLVEAKSIETENFQKLGKGIFFKESFLSITVQ